MAFVNIFYLSIPLLILGSITLEINWRNSQRKLLVEREEERKIYVTQIFQAQEDERKRIAQELHDDTIHSLLVIANSVESIVSEGKEQTRAQLNTQAKAIRGEIVRVTDDLKRLTRDLRPGILDNIGFIPALRWLVERIHQEGNIEVKMIVEGKERKIPHNTEVIIYRIAQEALNNIRRHSMASEAIVTVEFGDEMIRISILDNGKGFTVPNRINTLALNGKLGLIGMQERVNSLNGILSIKSKPQHGTTVIAEFEV